MMSQSQPVKLLFTQSECSDKAPSYVEPITAREVFAYPTTAREVFAYPITILTPRQVGTVNFPSHTNEVCSNLPK